MASETTWVEVADTAVKIGLSGIIAAASTYFLAIRSRKHDFDKEYFRRRQDVIERVSASFEPIHALFFEICIDYSGLAGVLTAGLSASAEQRDKYSDYLKKIGAALREMHVLEGKLLVAGATEATTSLRKYRLHSVEVNDMINLQRPKHTKEQIMGILEQLCQNRDHFYAELAKAFKTVSA